MCLTEYNEKETMEQFRDEGREEGREEGRKEGREEGREDARLSDVRKMMKNLHLTATQALQALEIPESEQSRYLGML